MYGYDSVHEAACDIDTYELAFEQADFERRLRREMEFEYYDNLPDAHVNIELTSANGIVKCHFKVIIK